MLSRLLCIGILSLASALAVSAESAPGPNRTDYLDKVAVLLDLNEGQKAQVQQLFDEQHQQMRAQMQSLREQAQSSDQRPDREQMRTQRLQAEKELVDKLRPVLSDVQLKKFEALRELTAPHGHGLRSQRGPAR
jgi:Spy/CpxP family protein refolding chaperone